jgi:hypothetical protein
MRLRRVKLSYVTSPILPYFSALSHKRDNFRKNIMEYKMCVLFFLQLLSETFLILRRIPRDINLRRSSCRQPVILPGFNKNLIFSTYFRKIHEYQFPRKTFQRDTSCSTRTDGRTDIPKLLAAFRNFVNAPRNIYPYHTPYVGRDNTVGVATSFV